MLECQWGQSKHSTFTTLILVLSITWIMIIQREEWAGEGKFDVFRVVGQTKRKNNLAEVGLNETIVEMRLPVVNQGLLLFIAQVNVD